MNIKEFIKNIRAGAGSFLSWFSTSVKQTTSSYCEIQTADSPTVLVANDGSLLSVLKILFLTAKDIAK